MKIATITEDGDVQCPYCGAKAAFKLKRGKTIGALGFVASGGLTAFSGKHGMPAQLKCLTCGKRMSRPSTRAATSATTPTPASGETRYSANPAWDAVPVPGKHSQQPTPDGQARSHADASDDDIVARLAQLAELKTSRMLSDEEFQAAKARLLGGSTSEESRTDTGPAERSVTSPVVVFGPFERFDINETVNVFWAGRLIGSVERNGTLAFEIDSEGRVEFSCPERGQTSIPVRTGEVNRIQIRWTPGGRLAAHTVDPNRQ